MMGHDPARLYTVNCAAQSGAVPRHHPFKTSKKGKTISSVVEKAWQIVYDYFIEYKINANVSSSKFLRDLRCRLLRNKVCRVRLPTFKEQKMHLHSYCQINFLIP